MSDRALETNRGYRGGDNRDNRGGGGDNRGGDNRGGDNRGGDNRGGDNRGGDNRGGDNRGGDNRGGNRDNRGGGGGGGGDRNHGRSDHRSVSREGGGGGNNFRGRGGGRQGGGQGGGRGGGRGGGGAKRLPGNMVERMEPVVPQQVKLAQQILARLGDFTAMTEDDDILTNTRALAGIFSDVGDLDAFPEEIGDLFAKCLGTLSVQVPILCSLLALIHQKVNGSAFVSIVAHKLQRRLMGALGGDEVPQAKLLLRALACLACCGVLGADGEGEMEEGMGMAVEGRVGLRQVLGALYDKVQGEVKGGGEGGELLLSEGAQAALYLLASTLVWGAPALPPSFLRSCLSLLTDARRRWKGAYGVGGLCAIFASFSPPEAQADATCLSPLGAEGGGGLQDGSAWDSLWEAAAASVLMLQSVLADTSYRPPGSMNPLWLSLVEDGDLPYLGTPGTSACYMGGVDLSAQLYLGGGADFAPALAAAVGGLGSRASYCTAVGTASTVLGSHTQWLRPRLTIFDADSSPQAKALSCLPPLDRYLATSFLEDVLLFFDPVVGEDGTKLGSLELLSAHLLAVGKLFPGSQEDISYSLVELLLQTLLSRPDSPPLHASVFRLLLELSRKQPLFTPVVALGANAVFQLVPLLDITAAAAFGRWFASHLINTQLSWPAQFWDFWVGELAEAEQGGQGTLPLFMKGVAEKLGAAVVPSKLKNLPREMLALLPPADAEAAPVCLLFSAEEGEALLSPALMLVRGGAEASASSVAGQLKVRVEQREDPEDLLEWMEGWALAPAGGGVALPCGDFCWRGAMLLQVLVKVGTATSALSTLHGLLDRYRDALCALAPSARQQGQLLLCVEELAAHSGPLFLLLLTETMRRGAVGVAAAAVYLVGDAYGCIDGEGREAAVCLRKLQGPQAHPCALQCLEAVADSAVVFAFQAVAQRGLLGGGMVLDAGMDLIPAPDPTSNTSTTSAATVTASASASASASMAVEGAGTEVAELEVEDDDEEGGGRRKRSRREPEEDTGPSEGAMDDGNGGGGGVGVGVSGGEREGRGGVEEREADPLWVAEEGVKGAVRGCRDTYSLLVGALVRVVTQQQVGGGGGGGGRRRDMDDGEEEGEGEEEGDDYAAVAGAVLRRTLRVFHGAERALARQQQMQVVLTATPEQVRALLLPLVPTPLQSNRWVHELTR